MAPASRATPVSKISIWIHRFVQVYFRFDVGTVVIIMPMDTLREKKELAHGVQQDLEKNGSPSAFPHGASGK